MTSRQKPTTERFSSILPLFQGTSPDRISMRWQSGARSPRPVWPTAPKSETRSATLVTTTEAPTHIATRARRCTTQAGTPLRATLSFLVSELSAAPGLRSLFAPATHWLRISEAGNSCKGKVRITAAVTSKFTTSSTTLGPPEVRIARKAMSEAVSSSPRKATPQVKVTLRKATTRKAEAIISTFGKAAGSFISFSTGSTRPRPSKEKKTLAASITPSASGRRGQAPATRAGVPSCASVRAPKTVPATTAVVMARMPRMFSLASCETSRSMPKQAKRGATQRVTTSSLAPLNTSIRFPETKSRKQQQTPPCTMKTKMSATLRPHMPNACSETSPRP
mmetsp:Transcript_108238/g.316575  ORF Transcript_108238/g.316575 Transcript_108238/m.316575 type:complete len:336 (+) Transcript_108238:170-1177(+)